MLKTSQSSLNPGIPQFILEEKEYINGDKIVSELNPITLDLIIKKLNLVCVCFDPFTQHGSDEAFEVLEEYELNKYLNDPFNFTNQLLKMTTDAQEEFQKRQ